MAANLIDGKAIAATIREEIRSEVEAMRSQHGQVPGLATVLVGARKDSQTYVRMSKRAHPLRPKAGPIGTPITVEVDGVSWTEHENLVAINYDNSLLGYACGNDLMGKILAKIHATGKPGWHFIDVYPAFRTRRFSVGLEEEIMEVPYLYQKSIITWKDHPHGFHFRYAFKLEDQNEV